MPAPFGANPKGPGVSLESPLHRERSPEELSMSKTDLQLKRDIENELLWDPKVNAAKIEVSVDGGAVALSGSVDTYPEAGAAEDAAALEHR